VRTVQIVVVSVIATIGVILAFTVREAIAVAVAEPVGLGYITAGLALPILILI
jgi:hypothetical protein